MAGISRCFDLPEDAVTEILARSSVKSLLRFRCVCKSWNDLLKSPRFIAKHLDYASSNDDNSRIAIKYSAIVRGEKNRGIPTTQAFMSFFSNEAVQLSHDIPSPFIDGPNAAVTTNDMVLFGPCDGVICVVATLGRYRTANDLIALWNPATREIRRLSVPNFHYRDDVAQAFWLTMGFGFDARSNDYKVVRIIDFTDCVTRRPIRHPVVEVYNSSTDSWRKTGIVLPNNVNLGPEFSTSYSNGIHYWISGDDSCDYFVLSFDFADEVFEKIPSPINNPLGATTLGEFNQTIAFSYIARDSENEEFCHYNDIWVLNINRDGEKKKKKTWTKLYRISVPWVRVAGFIRSGEVIVRVPNGHCRVTLELYDPSTRLFKNVRIYDHVDGMFQTVHYVESLVSFNGMRPLLLIC